MGVFPLSPHNTMRFAHYAPIHKLYNATTTVNTSLTNRRPNWLLVCYINWLVKSGKSLRLFSLKRGRNPYQTLALENNTYVLITSLTSVALHLMGINNGLAIIIDSDKIVLALINT
jgi:hypothetical protein